MHQRIIDPDSGEEGEEVLQPTRRGRGRGRQPQTRQVATPSQHMRIIDPDSYGDEEEEIVQPSRPQRGGCHQDQAAPSRPRNTRRQQQQHIETNEELVRCVPRRRATQSSQAATAAASQRRPRHCQQRADTVEDNQHNRTSRQRTRSIFEQSHSTKKSDSFGDAVLAVFALSSKGPIKEADIKPLLYRGGRYKDWQDGLNELNKCLLTAFGYNLVYDRASHQLFIKNDLTQIRGKINELYTYGTLQGIRIDNGSAAAARRSIPDENEFTEDDKKGLLFTILASIMMSSNAEMGHKMWLVSEDSLRQMCKAMKVPDEIIQKTISGNNAEFIRNGWIQKIEEKNANQDVFARYTWGPRAVTTLSTSAVFEKYCMVNKQSQLEWGNYKEIFQKLDEKNGLYQKR